MSGPHCLPVFDSTPLQTLTYSPKTCWHQTVCQERHILQELSDSATKSPPEKSCVLYQGIGQTVLLALSFFETAVGNMAHKADGSSSSTACGVNRASRANKTLYSLPVHCLTEADLREENAKGIMQHFHAPANSHNRFLASLTQQERAILRDFDRPSTYNSAVIESREGMRSDRPATAPTHRATSKAASSCSTGGEYRASTRQHCHVTEVAGPCAKQASRCLSAASAGRVEKPMPQATGNPSTMVEVDLLTGKLATAHISSTQPWRVAKVQAYLVPHSNYGYGEGGRRAPHQSYSFYKYYGFSGQGAKTSWASCRSKSAATAVQERS